MVKSFKNFILTEKLSVSQYRNVVKQIGNEYKTRYKDWFDGKWRIYIPLDVRTSTSYEEEKEKIDAPIEVYTVLTSSGYKIEDYFLGLAVDSKQRKVRIGKILTAQLKKNGDALHKSALKKFNERLMGTGVKSIDGDLVVISRHPYDIAGMSTDRGWTSCKNLFDGSNRHYIPAEIDSGVLVAYQISNDDKDINHPKGRILILPYFDENEPSDKFLYAVKTSYGSVSSNFSDIVQKWLDSKQGEKTGLYCLPIDVYSDIGMPSSILKFGNPNSEDNFKIAALFKRKYMDSFAIERTNDEEGSIVYKSSLEIRNYPNKKIPINIKSVEHHFYIKDCIRLNTLENGPKQINGKFGMTSYVINNCPMLKSLNFSPNFVSRYTIHETGITSLEGISSIDTELVIEKNHKLKTLSGLKQDVKLYGTLILSKNELLDSLEFAPASAYRLLAPFNFFRTLKYLPRCTEIYLHFGKYFKDFKSVNEIIDYVKLDNLKLFRIGIADFKPRIIDDLNRFFLENGYEIDDFSLALRDYIKR